MEWIQIWMERVGDTANENPLLFFQIISCFTILFLLLSDWYRRKYNPLYVRIRKRVNRNRKEAGAAYLYGIFNKQVDRLKSKIELDLHKANVRLEVKEYLSMMVIGGSVGLVIGSIFFPLATFFKAIVGFIDNPFIQISIARTVSSLIFGFVGLQFPKIWVKRLKAKRNKELDSQVQETIHSIADNLSTGQNINQAIVSASRELPRPMKDEFLITAALMETGVNFGDAMENLKQRIDSSDLHMAVNAIQIQEKTGGRLDSLLRQIAAIIQERQDIKNENRKTIAGSKNQGVILSLAPLLFLLLFGVMNPEMYLSMLDSGFGIILLIVAGVIYAFAVWWIFMILKYVSKEI